MNDHTSATLVPAAWPELAAPAPVLSCQKCALAGQRARVIWGEGDLRAPVMVILDNPGAREDREGHPFVCGTRQTLREALSSASLNPDRVYITYLLKCRPLRAYPKEKARSACLTYLEDQIQTLRPRLLLCFGNVVLKTLFGPDKEIKDYRGKWLRWHDVPALATYHPLAVRRRPNLFPVLVRDLSKAAERL